MTNFTPPDQTTMRPNGRFQPAKRLLLPLLIPIILLFLTVRQTQITAASPLTTAPWQQQTKLLANDGTAGDRLGQAVAIQGDTAVVGAFEDDANGARSGSVYIFIRSGSSWTQQAKLTASDAAEGSKFGFAVALDGDTVVIGAPGDSGDSGAVYVFTRSGATWSQQSKITASSPIINLWFGQSVAVNGDTAVIGEPLRYNGAIVSGVAYIFTRSGAVWSERATLTSADGAAGDRFGNTAAMSGNTVIVGAQWDNVGANNNQGSAYVFTGSGASWTQQARLISSDGAASDYFGNSVAISGDTAVIGAVNNDVNGSDSGAAYLFTRSGTTWSQLSRLDINDAVVDDWVGGSVAIDGDTAIISANGNGSSGAAYVFTRSGTTWSQQSRISSDGATLGDNFGVPVAIDGDTAVIGAYDDNDNGVDSGAAYVFVLPVTTTLAVTITGSGRVDLNPLGTQGSGTVNFTSVYTTSTVVTMTATADPDWSFSGWSGACKGAAVCVLTMDETKSVTAVFTVTTYYIFLPVIMDPP